MKQRTQIILRFAKPYQWIFAALFFCIIVTTFSGAVYPYIFGMLVDEVFYHKNMSVFLDLVIIYGITYFFNQLMHFGLNMSWANLMTKFLFDIRSTVYKSILYAKGERLAGAYSGDLISRMNQDVAEFMNFIHWNVFYTIGGALNLTISLSMIFYLNRWIGLFTILLTPAIVYLSRSFSKRYKKYYASVIEKKGLLSSWLFEIIQGMQDIKLLNAAGKIMTDFCRKSVKIIRLQIKASRVELVAERVNMGVSLLAQLILYTVSAVFIVKGQFTVGGFTACVTYFGTCINVFNTLNERIVNIAANMASIDRVIDIMQWERDDGGAEDSSLQIQKGEIVFQEVTFSYGSGKEVLRGINLSVKPGERVALVGYSGAGKTTIASLLHRLYEVTGGSIKIDRNDIRDYNLHKLRGQIGIVHQDIIFFDDTIRFNLCFSHDPQYDEMLWKALGRAHLDEIIRALPDGLDTKLSQQSITLSGGQRQRLAIARVFVQNPKILIFDEATSSLDYEAEQVIMGSWKELCQGRTTLIIAHRLSTILTSDKVAVLADGMVAGYGTHMSLLEHCSEYKELFHKQYGDNKETVHA